MEIGHLASRIENTLSQVQQTILYTLAKSDVTPQYQRALQQALPALYPEIKVTTNDRWVLLPELTYQACGGNGDAVGEIAAAWYLYYTAAYFMDHAEDFLEGSDEGIPAPPGVLINAASGYFFLANLILDDWRKKTNNTSLALETIEGFHKKLLLMCDGQQKDLSFPDINIKDYYDIARRKSGNFFALACWAGAKMANASEAELSAYEHFGIHIGVILQMLDDLEDWHGLQKGDGKFEVQKCHRTLPVVYAMEVMSSEDREKFKALIREVRENPSFDNKLKYQKQVEKAGAGFYLLVSIMREFDEARTLITDLHQEHEADKHLIRLIGSLLNF